MTVRSTPYLAALLLGLAMACSAPDSPPKARQTFVQAKIAERLLADPRPDSFTVLADRGRVIGDSGARVWVTAIIDYQCAACKRWHFDVLPTLRREYVESGRVRIAYLNRPLPERFNGQTAAIAAVCAAHQGKFWPASDKVFATIDLWSELPDARAFLDSVIITATGVDGASFRICTERARALKLIRGDIERVRGAGIDSVPTFLIGTHRIVGDAPVARFRAVIDSALAGR